MFFFYVEPGIQRKLIFPQISQINADFFSAQISEFSGNNFSSRSHKLVLKSTNLNVYFAQCGI